MPLPWDVIIWFIMAAFTVFAAIMVLASKEIVRNVVWLALTFVGVAITFIFLSAV